MSAVFLVSDTHFGHKNICKFTNYDGSPLRPWDDVAEMDEEMVKRWNETVPPKGKCYLLGDVCINRKSLPILDRLNGAKVLIKGNHDIFHLSDYTPYFRDIRSYHILNGMILSHIPIHPESLGRFGTNIHGHLHSNRVLLPSGEIDVRYHSVCVERNPNFAPILFEDMLKRITDEGGHIGFRNGNAPVM